jgi:hypothetical protein
MKSASDTMTAALVNSDSVMNKCGIRRVVFGGVEVEKKEVQYLSQGAEPWHRKAYCLLGIFDINMPLLYGEEEKAFQRL